MKKLLHFILLVDKQVSAHILKNMPVPNYKCVSVLD